MAFFNPTQPIFRRKQQVSTAPDLEGIARVQIKIKQKTLLSLFYTRIDRVFAIWALLSACIFFTAQFSPIDWVAQATLWSILSIVGSLMMAALTAVWVRGEQLRWLLYSWAALMLGGTIATDLAIAFSWGWVLMNLCSFWLGLIALGYALTALGMRSRAFVLACIIHLLGIVLLPWVGGFQFLTTGLILAVTLLLFAEMQWDMYLPRMRQEAIAVQQSPSNRPQQAFLSRYFGPSIVLPYLQVSPLPISAKIANSLSIEH